MSADEGYKQYEEQLMTLSSPDLTLKVSSIPYNDLRRMSKGFGLSAAGKKIDIVDRIKAHILEKGEEAKHEAGSTINTILLSTSPSASLGTPPPSSSRGTSSAGQSGSGRKSSSYRGEYFADTSLQQSLTPQVATPKSAVDGAGRGGNNDENEPQQQQQLHKEEKESQGIDKEHDVLARSLELAPELSYHQSTFDKDPPHEEVLDVMVECVEEVVRRCVPSPINSPETAYSSMSGPRRQSLFTAARIAAWENSDSLSLRKMRLMLSDLKGRLNSIAPPAQIAALQRRLCKKPRAAARSTTTTTGIFGTPGYPSTTPRPKTRLGPGPYAQTKASSQRRANPGTSAGSGFYVSGATGTSEGSGAHAYAHMQSPGPHHSLTSSHAHVQVHGTQPPPRVAGNSSSSSSSSSGSPAAQARTNSSSRSGAGRGALSGATSSPTGGATDVTSRVTGSTAASRARAQSRWSKAVASVGSPVERTPRSGVADGAAGAYSTVRKPKTLAASTLKTPLPQTNSGISSLFAPPSTSQKLVASTRKPFPAPPSARAHATPRPRAVEEQMMGMHRFVPTVAESPFSFITNKPSLVRDVGGGGPALPARTSTLLSKPAPTPEATPMLTSAPPSAPAATPAAASVVAPVAVNSVVPPVPSSYRTPFVGSIPPPAAQDSKPAENPFKFLFN